MTYNVVEKRGIVLVWRAFGDNLSEYPLRDVLENPFIYDSLTSQFGAPTGVIKKYRVLQEVA